MKKNLATIAVCMMMTMVVSCEYDSPTIKFQQSTTITNDYSEMVNAIRDQTLTLSQKMDVLENAMKSQTLTLAQKAELLTKAYENGVLKYEEMNAKLIGEINAMKATAAEKLEAVKTAVEAQTTDLNTKLALIDNAVKSGFADNAAATGLLKDAVNALGKTVGEKQKAIEQAIGRQTEDLGMKMGLIKTAVENGFIANADAAALVKKAVEALKGSVEEKLEAINKTIDSNDNMLSEKLAAIEGALSSGIAGESSTLGLVKKAIDALNASAATSNEKLEAIKDAVESPASGLNVKLAAIESALSSGIAGESSTLGLVKKAIDALNASAATSNEKLEAIKDAVESPASGLNVKLAAIKEAVEQGLANADEKHGLILKAVNSVSSYTFTEDELLEVGGNYMLVDAAFWDANHANQEVAKALKQLVPLSLPARYKFWHRMSTGKYPLSDSEPTSFYGPDLEKDGILTEIRNTGEAMLAVDLTDNGAPAYRTKDHHRCYLLKKTYKSFYGVFRVNKGQRAAGLDLKLEEIKQVLKDKETSESMGTNDKFTQTESEIVYEYWSEAEQTPTGVFGYKGLKYDNQRYGNPCRYIEFIFIKQ